MSLNQINLNTNLLISLYGNVLVETPVKTDANNKPQYLGSAAKAIGIGVNYTEHPFISDEDLTFLTNILNACKLSIGDVAIINFSTVKSPALQTFQELILKKVILFGPGPLQAGLPMNFPPYQVQEFDGCSYLLAPTLKELGQNVKEKGKLWQTLQKFFPLS